MRRVAVLLGLLLVPGCGGGSTGDGRPAAHPRHARPHRTERVTELGPNPLSGAAARRARVPILMYHLVNAPPPGTAYPELWMPAPRFAAEMHALRARGYRGTTLATVLRAWRTGSPLPHRPIVVSFDDGYYSQYSKAFPVLRRLGWPGVVDIVLHDLGPKGLPVSAVRVMMAAGWQVGSHTVNHLDLTAVGNDQLRYELVASKRILRARLGVTPDLFCYPAGRFDPRVEAATRAAGYRAATSTQLGIATPGSDRYALPRVRVNGSETPQALMAQLAALGA
jgi:peptidoglycan/xylan/chitin deacetylase (PgdA/CDA1 family)